MNTKILYFCLGVLLCFITISVFESHMRLYEKSYHFEDIDKRKRFMHFLDQQNVLYEYKIDQLQRHWISPLIKDDHALEKIMQQFEASEEKIMTKH